MKKTIFISILCIFFSFSLFAQQNNENYYYYQGEKIFLQKSTNKILLKFAQNANKEQIRSLINSNRSLQLTSEMNVDDNILDFAILETKNDNDTLSSAIIESFKTHPIIVSATPLFLYNEISQGLTDEFIVKIKEETSYEQMLSLVEKNHCKIVEENEFVKNQFMISVYKNAKLNAMEMSRLFFESDFFEFSEPNFVLFDILNSNDAHFNQQWALNNTGQNGGTLGVDIKAEQAWQISTGTNIKVAVIDEGVDLTHPDLQANLLPGYDATGGNSGGAPTNSGESHGTACAGIIGAIKDNGQGISGIAPNCKILPINVTFGNKVTTSNWLANAINWAWWNGADIISNSWGGGSAHTGITNAINEL